MIITILSFAATTALFLFAALLFTAAIAFARYLLKELSKEEDV